MFLRLFLLSIMLFGFLQGRAVAWQDPLLRAHMHSPMLTRFFGNDREISGDVLFPASYYKEAQRRYPVIYVVHALGGSGSVMPQSYYEWREAMGDLHHEFIVVFLEANLDSGPTADFSPNFGPNFDTVHTLFADSENDGPWATALTSEYIPQIDARLRTIPDANSRFLAGHSSGGWASLWLQVNYPKVFGGVWSISPDPVDFHDFLGPDLTSSSPQNFYHDLQGKTYGMWRTNGRDTETLRAFVFSRVGVAQFDSDDSVYSPRGPRGKPMPLFDRKTGLIDENVARYWEKHFDITHILKERWNEIGPDLRGKLHVYVGSEDTFHLEAPVARMRDTLAGLDAGASIVTVPEADHWTVFRYKGGLIKEIVRQMIVQTGG